MIVELSSVYMNIHWRNLLFVNRSEYKAPSCEIQDLRRGRRCPASRIGQSLEEGGATRADFFGKSPRHHSWRAYKETQTSEMSDT